ncbi:hypothetical protein VTJ83DRAFT_6032 [Remersonia thermophila]|uniref:Uncharacterized protein n=1 Tax=Remersonia thermophila TaxID=72144 RepID=A0ABR4D8I8_9PEZI
MSNSAAEFHSSVPGSKPLETSGVRSPAPSQHGPGSFAPRTSKDLLTLSNHALPPQHQLGRQVGREAVPEFHAETHPPGAAPAEATYQPHLRPADTRRPPSEQQPLSADPLAMPGATSGEVHSASTQARPMEGQTSQEVRTRRTEHAGLEGRGATASEETVESKAGRVW